MNIMECFGVVGVELVVVLGWFGEIEFVNAENSHSMELRD
jgi:hypothetical protein